MGGLWTAIGLAQQAVIAVGGLWNATYFGLRAREGQRGRRVAAGLLALLFLAIALEALAAIPIGASAAEVMRRTPLLVATVGIAFVVSYRPIGAGEDRR